jgi:hypothetical protein
MARVRLGRAFKFKNYFGGKMNNRYALFVFLGTLFIILVSILLIVAFIFVIPVLAREAAVSAEYPNQGIQLRSFAEPSESIFCNSPKQGQSWVNGWDILLVSGSSDKYMSDRQYVMLISINRFSGDSAGIRA